MSLGKPQETQLGKPFAQRNGEGGLEISVVGPDGAAWYIGQAR